MSKTGTKLRRSHQRRTIDAGKNCISRPGKRNSFISTAKAKTSGGLVGNSPKIRIYRNVQHATSLKVQPFWGRAWKWIKKTAKRAWRGVKKGFRGFTGLVGSVLKKSWKFLGKAGSWLAGKLKKLGKGTLNWLKRAGKAVWRSIKWFGKHAWAGIKWLGAFLWEKLSHAGGLAWTFISRFPKRLWRVIVHGWDLIKGTGKWIWSGLKGAAGHAWKAVKGTFNWIKGGIRGMAKWLSSGIRSGAKWAIDFIRDPSLDKLKNGLLGSVRWLGSGVAGLARWGWRGIVGAAKWGWEGLKGVGKWLWKGLKGGAEWAGKMLLYLIELLGGGEALQLIWGLIFRMRKLTKNEIDASKTVHPEGMIPYGLIRVDENSIVSKIGGAAVTSMHVLHFPSGSISLDLMVHELTHVAQYEKAGAIYMPQALHAQAKYGVKSPSGRGTKDAYDYEREGTLTALRSKGTKFKDLNRESQAELVQDYYLCGPYPNSCTDMQPFIEDMRRGEF